MLKVVSHTSLAFPSHALHGFADGKRVPCFPEALMMDGKRVPCFPEALTMHGKRVPCSPEALMMDGKRFGKRAKRS